MKSRAFLARCAAAAFVVAMTSVPALAAVDTIEAPTGYFVPTDAQKYDAGYWRDASEDWGWTHNAIGSSFTTATLRISAFDVDYGSGERDAIYIGADNTGIFLGYLAGANNAWAYTDFDVTAYATEIAAGLQIFMDIDSLNTGWLVTLAKSVLTTDGDSTPPPVPGVPEPATLVLFGLGLAGLALARRRKTA